MTKKLEVPTRATFTCRACAWQSDNVKEAQAHDREAGHAVLKWIGVGSYQVFREAPEGRA